jgi:hypothetical protein
MAGIEVGRAFSLVAALVASALLVSLARSAEARIARIEITSLQSPSFEDVSFGTTGQYEKLVGRRGEVDPSTTIGGQLSRMPTALEGSWRTQL